MNSPPNVLLGAQTPRLSRYPEGVGSDGAEAIELAERCGIVLDPWQRLVLDKFLGYRRDGKWSCPTCLLVVPRQNGKGEVLVVRMLAGLFLFGEKLITYTAHEFKTAQEHFRRIATVVETTPELAAMVERIRYAHGSEGIELKKEHGGARLRFLARSRGSGRGFSGDCVILDEAYELPTEALDALIPTMSARMNETDAGPQLWYSSSAGMETSFELARVRQRALEGSDRIGLAEWSAADDADPNDPEAVAQANPGLGIRLSMEFIETERDTLSEAGFARERLGVWPSSQQFREIPEDKWKLVQDSKAAPKEPLVFGVDILPDRSAAAICVSDGKVIELTSTPETGWDHRQGTGWVVPRLRQLIEVHGGTVALDSGGPAAGLAEVLEADGIPVAKLTYGDLAIACGKLYDDIIDNKLDVIPATPLDTAVGGVTKRQAGDRFVWSRSASPVDVTPLVAATLAYHTANVVTAPDPGFVFAFLD